MNPIEQWKDAQAAIVKNEMTIQSFEQAGDVYRVDAQKVPIFIPQFSNRQMVKEDKIIPRVCVADTLFGCLYGFSRFFYDFFDGTPDGKKDDYGNRYKGGVIISRLPYESLIVPSKKLVPDVNESGEKWLVSYDKDHASYPCEVIGKAFVAACMAERRDRGLLYYTYTVYIEVSDGATLRLSTTVTLGSGYHKLVLGGLRGHTGFYHSPAAKTSAKEFELSEVSKADYMKVKGQGIDLLNHNLAFAAQW